MEIRNRVIIGAPISSLGLVLVLGASPAEASQRYLCMSVPSACEYAGPDAPVLAAMVCWNGRIATLQGSASCPSGASALWVEHGVIDPATGAVQAYIALADACDQGWCTELAPGETMPVEGSEICCGSDTDDEGGCTLDVLDCPGEILWCDGVTQSNGDGTIECVETDV